MSSMRLIIALSLSIVLIMGAAWFRFVRIPPYNRDGLVAVEPIAKLTSEEVFLEDISRTASPAPASSEPLTQTDVISRQLFSDFIELASQGKAGSETLNTLAERYTGDVLNLVTPTPIELSRVIVVVNSEENLALYGNTITNIYNKYKSSATTQFESGDFIGADGTTSLEFMGTASSLYRAAVNELLAVEVPLSLANNHLELVNTYSGNAEAMAILSNALNDPMQAIAAVNILTKNSSKEPELLTNIRLSLMANGVIFDSSI